MTNRQTNPEKPKYFDLDINGIGYLNRAREVTPENGIPFLSVTIAALRGPADNVQHTHFDCVVSGEEAKDLVRQLMPAVFFHNHPSGVAEPSHADEAITKRLKDALALVDIRVLDHFIVTAGESVSIAERGLL